MGSSFCTFVSPSCVLLYPDKPKGETMWAGFVRIRIGLKATTCEHGNEL